MAADRAGRRRALLLLMLTAATLVIYLHRIVISVLVKDLKEAFELTDVHYGYLLTAFQLTYTLGFLGAGRMIDALGTRLGYLLTLLGASLSATLTGSCYGFGTLVTTRGLVGLFQSGTFPGAIKAVAEWFPQRRRAFATSLFNSGPSIAQIVGPPAIAGLALWAGWRAAVYVTGATGLAQAVLWPVLYSTPPREDAEDRPAVAGVATWRELLRHRPAYGIMLGKFLTDPVWWFYLFWLPNYLYEKRGLDLKGVGLVMPVIYIIAVVLGNVAGWAAGHLMARGWAPLKARRAVMAACAACLPVTALTVVAPRLWMVVALVSLACGAHNGFSANIFTLSSDCFPKRMVGSMTGLAGFAGGFGGIVFSTFTAGYIITAFGYVPLFVLMGLLHPLAAGLTYVFVRPSAADGSVPDRP